MTVWPVSGSYGFTPIPTRPPYFHEYLCSPGTELNESAAPVLRTPGISSADENLQVWAGDPETWFEVNRTGGEFEPDGTPRVLRFTPDEGYRFLIVPVTVANPAEEEFCFDIGRISLTDSLTGAGYPADEVMDFLPDPFAGGNISPGEERRGRVLFQVPVDSDEYELSVLLTRIRVVYRFVLNQDG
jgi:hypothetical protein